MSAHSEASRCVVSSRHDPDKTPRALPGLRLCRGHRAKVERMIAELPALFDDLGTALTSAERPGERVTSSREPGLSLNRLVVDARDEIHAELVRLVRYVVEERGLHALPADEVPAMAAWLTVHADWLAAQDDADETHDNLDRLSRDCYSLAFPSGRRHFEIPGVTCQAPLWCDITSRTVVRCEGRLVALLTPSDELEMPSEIECDSCGVQVPSRQWYAWAQERQAS